MKTAIHVSTEAYNRAEDYAKSHNTSVSQMVEDYLLTLMVIGRKNTIQDKAERRSWREMEIPEEVRKMSLPKVPDFPDDDKSMIGILLREKYESLS